MYRKWVFLNSIITYNVVSLTTLCITFCYINTNLYSAFFTESYFVVHKYDFGEVLFLNNIIGNINTNDFKFFYGERGRYLFLFRMVILLSLLYTRCTYFIRSLF